MDSTRTEKDSLGTVRVPAEAYYGAQTQRAVDNFRISGMRPHHMLVTATALVKLAAARANMELGQLDRRRGEAIEQAAREVVDGRLRDQFVVDVFQAGAGTSHNMNANEVIANRAIETLGGNRGDYTVVHPNDHVNMAQSTNDVFPTATKLAALMMTGPLLEAVNALAEAFEAKGVEFDGIVKSGRTHLQDAVPIRLGQEFAAYGASVRRAASVISQASSMLTEINLGATAAGTGLNSHPRYAATVAAALGQLTGFPLKPAANLVETTESMAPLGHISAALRFLALELIRIANDLRLLSSGPRTGLGEIKLPELQPGSSIMPGKVNPVIPEMIDMVGFQVVGNDVTVAMAVQAGQLELNVMMPVMAFNILQSFELLTNGCVTLREKCVDGITANRERAEDLSERSLGLATALNPYIGYERAAKVAQEAAASGKTVRQVVLERGIMSGEELDRVLNPMNMTGPREK